VTEGLAGNLLVRRLEKGVGGRLEGYCSAVQSACGISAKVFRRATLLCQKDLLREDFLIWSVLRPGVILARIKNTKDCATARTDEQETSFNNCGREPDYPGPPHFSGRCDGLQRPPMSHKIGISSRVTEKRSDRCLATRPERSGITASSFI
jgi:hypothetical protein